jgi:tRNA 2-thiouridine synthesizing protein A
MNLHELDARNLLCPLPVIRVQDKVKGLAAGDVLEVVCTDPGATSDIPAWCRINGHKVLTTRTQDHEIVIRIEVGSIDG